jgi:hypothetical protein
MKPTMASIIRSELRRGPRDTHELGKKFRNFTFAEESRWEKGRIRFVGVDFAVGESKSVTRIL